MRFYRGIEMPEDKPLKGVLFGGIRLNAFPLTQVDAIKKDKPYEERLHPRDLAGKFAPKGAAQLTGMRRAPKPPKERRPEEPKAPKAPRVKKPPITIKRAKSEADSMAYDLSNERVKRRDGSSVGRVTVDEVSETATGVEIYMSADNLKIGGIDDEDSNDYGAQGKLLDLGLKDLKKRFPRKKMHGIGGEKGFFGFFIEDKRPKRAFKLQAALKEMLGDEFYWPKDYGIRSAFSAAKRDADGSGDVAKLEAALQGIVDAWGDTKPEWYFHKNSLKAAKKLLRRKKPKE